MLAEAEKLNKSEKSKSSLTNSMLHYIFNLRNFLEVLYMHFKNWLPLVMTLIICLTLSTSAVASNQFLKDTPDDAWYAKAIK